MVCAELGGEVELALIRLGSSVGLLLLEDEMLLLDMIILENRINLSAFPVSASRAVSWRTYTRAQRSSERANVQQCSSTTRLKGIRVQLLCPARSSTNK
jgi:hypothetical protein